jgi:hypothetical protein
MNINTRKIRKHGLADWRQPRYRVQVINLSHG